MTGIASTFYKYLCTVTIAAFFLKQESSSSIFHGDGPLVPFWSHVSRSLFKGKKRMFQTKVEEEIKTHILCSITFLFEIVQFTTLKNNVEPDRPQMTMTHAHSMLHTKG
jgi:hypothetical protein